MNILIPDSWLREYLKTDATAKEIKEFVSLCGPSVERINTVGKETVYDIEITTNRIDSYSVYGVAREAATILPRFGKKANLLPFQSKKPDFPKSPLGIHIEDTQGFCRRILAVKIHNITLGPSPLWLKKRLELVGQRSLNNIVDITNYVMWETGHPMHAFDYDRLTEKKIIMREAKKGEIVISLDNKKHSMVGGEMIFDDGTGTIIDIPGIMGTANTVVTPETKNVLLFIENSDPTKIRFSSMTHAIRTQAAIINEKDPDPELALIAMNRGVSLATELTKGTIESQLYDSYPKHFLPYPVTLRKTKLASYIGTVLGDKEIHTILTGLGLATHITKDMIVVKVPSYRRDITLDVDIIEEIARMYGYHTIETHLPSKEPPVVLPDRSLTMEEDMKIRLRDWGYTETYTYSMISEKLMDIFHLDKENSYTIANPLSEEWVYMRPSLVPSMVHTLEQNLHFKNDLKLFELSKVYAWRKNDLPAEKSVLLVAWTGHKFPEAKGLAQTLTPDDSVYSINEVDTAMLTKIGIHTPVTLLEVDVDRLVKNRRPACSYVPIPKYPPAVEDLAFIVPNGFAVGPLLAALGKAHPLVSKVSLLDAHEHTRTVHVEYLHKEKNLTADDIRPVRAKLISLAKSGFGADLKTA